MARRIAEDRRAAFPRSIEDEDGCAARVRISPAQPGFAQDVKGLLLGGSSAAGHRTGGSQRARVIVEIAGQTIANISITVRGDVLKSGSLRRVYIETGSGRETLTPAARK